MKADLLKTGSFSTDSEDKAWKAKEEKSQTKEIIYDILILEEIIQYIILFNINLELSSQTFKYILLIDLVIRAH